MSAVARFTVTGSWMDSSWWSWDGFVFVVLSWWSCLDGLGLMVLSWWSRLDGLVLVVLSWWSCVSIILSKVLLISTTLGTHVLTNGSVISLRSSWPSSWRSIVSSNLVYVCVSISHRCPSAMIIHISAIIQLTFRENGFRKEGVYYPLLAIIQIIMAHTNNRTPYQKVMATNKCCSMAHINNRTPY